MKVDIADAMHLLEDLVCRAEAGEEIVLTRQGHPIIRLVPVSRPLTAEEKEARINAIVADARGKALPGPDAAHCSDFLYDDRGLPR